VFDAKTAQISICSTLEIQRSNEVSRSYASGIITETEPSYSERAVYDAWLGEDLRTALGIKLWLTLACVGYGQADRAPTFWFCEAGSKQDAISSRHRYSTQDVKGVYVPRLTASAGKLYNLDAVVVGHVGCQDSMHTVVIAANQTSWRLTGGERYP
jgi:hypothetical protein